MPYIIRKIDTGKWVGTQRFWNEDDDFEADPLGDLSTIRNTLSVYEVESDQDALRVVAAMIAPLSGVAKRVGYYKISPEILEDNGFTLVPTKGDIADKGVQKWHRDIVSLSAKSIFSLVKILREYAQSVDVPQIDWTTALKQSLHNEFLKERHIKVTDDEVRKKIGVPPIKKNS